MKLYCVIPFYNEEKYLKICLTKLLQQTDLDFTLILVDNASSDDSVKLAKTVLSNASVKSWKIIKETEKGTGSAADTGFRYAITQGATHIIRTDADCAPGSRWIEYARSSAKGNSDVLVLGKLSYQNDDNLAAWYDPFMFWFAQTVSQIYGWVFWRSKEYRIPFVMGAGNNMLISAGLYNKSGGFPRVPLEVKDDDVALFDKVRKITFHIYKNKHMRSNSSMRRVRKHGYLKTMLYYWGRKFKPANVDVR